MRAHHAPFSRQTVLLWHTKEFPRIAEPQAQTKGAGCRDPMGSGASNAISVYQGAAKVQSQPCGAHPSRLAASMEEKRKTPPKGRWPRRGREPLAPCLMSGTFLLGIPSSSQIDHMVCCSQEPISKNQEWSLECSLGMLAPCCLWAFEPALVKLTLVLARSWQKGC